MSDKFARLEQLSIFLENRSGCLAAVIKELGAAKINIRALSLADTSDFGILRLIISNPAKAAEILKNQGFTVGRATVLAVELEDVPGSLGSLLDLFSTHGINVEYMYACARLASTLAMIIFRLDRTDDAIMLLEKLGRRQILPETLYAT